MLMPTVIMCDIVTSVYRSKELYLQRTLNEKSVTAMLTGGETYLVRVGRRNMDCNGSTSFKIEKAKTVKSVEIKNKPDQNTVYNTDGEYRGFSWKD